MSKFVQDITHLRRYVDGELSPKEMHEIERAALEDEMLMDILIGLELEKDQHRDSQPMADIQQRITQRVHAKNHRKLFFYNRYVQVAAALLVIAAVGILFWGKQRKPTTPENTITATHTAPQKTDPNQRNTNTEQLLDSTSQAHKEAAPQSLSHTTEPIRKPTNRNLIQDRPLTEQEKQILAYTPTQRKIEMNQEIAGTLNLGHPKHESDVIIINTEAGDNKSTLIASNSRKSLQAKVPEAKISDNPAITPSAAQMRARLNSLGLDPQTSFILGQVIDQQSRQPLAGVEVKDIQTNKIVVTDSAGRFGYAANNKKNLEITAVGYKSKEVAAESGEQTILLTPDENLLEEVVITNTTKSTPIVGWEKYKKDLNKEVTKLTDGDYEFNVRMELDKKGKPTRIVILKSSHPSLNPKIIQLIERSPLWKQGSDWKNIYIQIKR